MSTVWDKLRAKVKVTVDEAGLEVEKQRKIYGVRKEIGQHEATIREIKAELGRLQEQRTAQLAQAGEVAYELQKGQKLGEKWQQVATALETIPDIDGKIAEEQGAIGAIESDIDRLREQIESVREEYKRKREVMREEVAPTEPPETEAEAPVEETVPEKEAPKPKAEKKATDEK